jgi:hypothetical protein
VIRISGGVRMRRKGCAGIVIVVVGHELGEDEMHMSEKRIYVQNRRCVFGGKLTILAHRAATFADEASERAKLWPQYS